MLGLRLSAQKSATGKMFKVNTHLKLCMLLENLHHDASISLMVMFTLAATEGTSEKRKQKMFTFNVLGVEDTLHYSSTSKYFLSFQTRLSHHFCPLFEAVPEVLS